MVDAPRMAIVPKSESAGDRARAAQRAAKVHADEHIGELQDTLRAAEIMADEIGQGGDAYAAGVRALCKRLQTYLDQTQRAIDSIQERRR